jgi:hypothetical protein
MSGKALKLIQPVSKRNRFVALFKQAIISGIIQPGESIVGQSRSAAWGRHSAWLTANCALT